MTSPGGFSAIFIRRPVGTILLTLGLALAGFAAFLPAAGRAAAAGRLPDNRGQRADGGREPGDDGDERRDAARTLSRGHCRRHRDDLVEHGRLDPHHAAIQRSAVTSREPRATYRPRSTPRAPICPRACDSNPTYRKVNPADAPITDPVADLRHADARPDLRRRIDGRWCRRCRRSTGVGQVTIGGGAARAVRVEIDPVAAVPVRHRSRGRPRRDRGGQRPQSKRRDRGRHAALAALCKRPGDDAGRLQAARDRLPQRRAGASRAMSRQSRRVRKAGAISGCRTASRRCWSF